MITTDFQNIKLSEDASTPAAAFFDSFPSFPPVHIHTDCGSRERLWLPKSHRVTATTARHPFCLDCGTVKNLTMPHAKPLGYYLDGLANLKESLERSLIHSKLVQVQRHLIAEKLRTRSEFEDPYGTPGSVQQEAYVEIVLSVRPDLDEELILRMLPDRRRRRRPVGSQRTIEQFAGPHSRH